MTTGKTEQENQLSAVLWMQLRRNGMKGMKLMFSRFDKVCFGLGFSASQIQTSKRMWGSPQHEQSEEMRK